MNKIYMLSVTCACLLLSGQAMAIDSTGCGFGSIAWRGQSGPAPQILAATTNASFGNQTFGISSGTMGCDPNGRITGGTQRIVFEYLQNNMEQYAFDAAKGEGETLETIAGMLNMDKDTFAEKSQQNFAALFPNGDVDAIYVTNQIFEILKA